MEETKDNTDQDLLEGIRSGKELSEKFAAAFSKRYLINGKTMSEWEHHFRLSVPISPDPEQTKQLSMKLLSLIEEASFYKIKAEAITASLNGSRLSKSNKRYQEIVDELKSKNQKLPAAATLEQMSRDQQLDDATGAADIAKTFWKSVLENLSECRKLLEQVTMNNGIQAKMVSQGGH